MAVTVFFLLLTALMATIASAGVYAGSGASSFGFNSPMTYINPIKLPQLPGFNLPSPPPLPWPSNFPFPNFPQPQVPNFPPFKPGTDQGGASQGPRPGSQYQFVLSSQNTATRGENGQVDQTGGATLVTNNNGEVTVHHIGNAPPEVIYTQYKSPSFADFKEPEYKQQNFRRERQSDWPTFDSFDSFDTFTFKPSTDSIKNYVPGKNEKFQGSTYSYSSYSNDLNGKKTSGGIASTVTNDNGKIEEKDYVF